MSIFVAHRYLYFYLGNQSFSSLISRFSGERNIFWTYCKNCKSSRTSVLLQPLQNHRKNTYVTYVYVTKKIFTVYNEKYQKPLFITNFIPTLNVRFHLSSRCYETAGELFSVLRSPCSFSHLRRRCIVSHSNEPLFDPGDIMSYLWSCSFQHAQPHSSVCARVFMYHLYGQTAEYLVPIHTLVSGLCCTCTRVVCTGDERNMIYSEGSRVIHFSKVPQSPRKLPFSTILWPVLYLSWICYSKNMLPLLSTRSRASKLCQTTLWQTKEL